MILTLFFLAPKYVLLWIFIISFFFQNIFDWSIHFIKNFCRDLKIEVGRKVSVSFITALVGIISSELHSFPVDPGADQQTLASVDRLLEEFGALWYIACQRDRWIVSFNFFDRLRICIFRAIFTTSLQAIYVLLVQVATDDVNLRTITTKISRMT